MFCVETYFVRATGAYVCKGDNVPAGWPVLTFGGVHGAGGCAERDAANGGSFRVPSATKKQRVQVPVQRPRPLCHATMALPAPRNSGRAPRRCQPPAPAPRRGPRRGPQCTATGRVLERNNGGNAEGGRTGIAAATRVRSPRPRPPNGAGGHGGPLAKARSPAAAPAPQAEDRRGVPRSGDAMSPDMTSTMRPLPTCAPTLPPFPAPNPPTSSPNNTHPTSKTPTPPRQSTSKKTYDGTATHTRMANNKTHSPPPPSSHHGPPPPPPQPCFTTPTAGCGCGRQRAPRQRR